MLESSTSTSPWLSLLTLKLSNENIGGSSSKWSNEVKRLKLKRKKDENISTIIHTIKREKLKTLGFINPCVHKSTTNLSDPNEKNIVGWS